MIDNEQGSADKNMSLENFEQMAGLLLGRLFHVFTGEVKGCDVVTTTVSLPSGGVEPRVMRGTFLRDHQDRAEVIEKIYDFLESNIGDDYLTTMFLSPGPGEGSDHMSAWEQDVVFLNSEMCKKPQLVEALEDAVSSVNKIDMLAELTMQLFEKHGNNAIVRSEPSSFPFPDTAKKVPEAALSISVYDYDKASGVHKLLRHGLGESADKLIHLGARPPAHDITLNIDHANLIRRQVAEVEEPFPFPYPIGGAATLTLNLKRLSELSNYEKFSQIVDDTPDRSNGQQRST